MKKFHYFLLILSAVLYFLPFFLSAYLWWLIFLFPVPFLYVTCMHNLSFLHGYIWGLSVFALHASGGIYSITCIAQKSWLIASLLGIGMVLYLALFPAILFSAVTKIIRFGEIKNLLLRLTLWTAALFIFIVWADSYCWSIFGVIEGYPLMHPLLPLVQQSQLLMLVPIIGKPAVTVLFLLFSMSIVTILWYKNYLAIFFLCCASLPWGMSLFFTLDVRNPDWYPAIKSLPYMMHCNGDDSRVAITIVGNHVKKIIEQFPETEIIIMPESAFNVSNFAQLSSLLQLWNESHIGKPIHILFGACRMQEYYYNSLHWIYNGILQGYCDKKHTMLVSERLPWMMNNDLLRKLYQKDGLSITPSCNERCAFKLLNDCAFVPYICSELFFNCQPDDIYQDAPIIAVVNDIWFLNNYIQDLLLLLARGRAIQWQRDIIYVSYTQSVFINKRGMVTEMN